MYECIKIQKQIYACMGEGPKYTCYLFATVVPYIGLIRTTQFHCMGASCEILSDEKLCNTHI